jgi:hypothetical protein
MQPTRRSWALLSLIIAVVSIAYIAVVASRGKDAFAASMVCPMPSCTTHDCGVKKECAGVDCKTCPRCLRGKEKTS